MATHILLRGDLAAAWTSINPILDAREAGVETDTHRLKVGDGVTPWTSLPYTIGSSPSDATAAVKGVLLLTNALGGTAALPTALGLNNQTELAALIKDTTGGAMVSGTGITVSYDPTAKQITVANAYVETIETAPPGSIFVARKDATTGFWPAGWDANGDPIYTGGSATAGVRPTGRADVTIDWEGADPSPTSVPSGTGGPLQGVDRRSIPNA